MIEYYYIISAFIPLAFLAGWWTSRKKNHKKQIEKRRALHPDYFRGLNYVLNEQPDKAIEVFIKMIEVDSETVETHLALGNLFRKRGEVDRAIRIHQNLIARPALNSEYRAQAYLELGMDYLRLGILDRAEKLFLDLVEMDILTIKANEHLLEIYQQEHEWENAINIARKLEQLTASDYGQTIAQFHCELALKQLSIENDKQAKKIIKHALRLDPKCVRASMMEGNLLLKNEDYKGAISAYKRVVTHRPEYSGVVVSALQQCYDKIGKDEQFKKYLFDIIDSCSDFNVLKILSSLISRDAGNHEAINFMIQRLNDKPTVEGVNQLLQYIIPESDSASKNNLIKLKELTEKILQARSEYQCEVCGFDAKGLHWYCPGCKNWSSIKPIMSV